MTSKLSRKRQYRLGSKTKMITVKVIAALVFCLLLSGYYMKVESELATSPEDSGFRNDQQHQSQSQSQWRQRKRRRQRQRQRQRHLQMDRFDGFDVNWDIHGKGRANGSFPQSHWTRTDPPVGIPSGRIINRDKLAEYEYDRDDVVPPEAKDADTYSSPTVAPAGEDQLDDDYNVVIIDDELPWDYTEDEPEVDPDQVNGPTTAPTAFDIDDDDYTAVVIGDDVPWDDIAVKETAKDAFEAIESGELDQWDQIGGFDTDTSGNFSSPNDDFDEYAFSPSAYPTASARPSSSYQPTPLASATPTNYPTTKPSTSLRPSDYPSFLPTDIPSTAPSFAPTKTCHDDVMYRSPINGLNCFHHYGTNCLKWRHIGLNLTELEGLVGSCPETCNIECGSFHLFSAEISFRISRVSGFMDPEDVEAFFEFSVDYLEDYVRTVGWVGSSDEASGSNDNLVEARDEGSVAYDDDFLNDDVVDGSVVVFEIENPELLKQNMVEYPTIRIIDPGEDGGEFSKPTGEQNGNDIFRRNRLLRSRKVQDIQRTKQKQGGESIVKTDEALDVVVTFEGFTIGMNPESMSELLVLGIDDVDFTRQLQKSGIDFFSDATVSSAMETVEDDVTTEDEILEEEKEEEGNTTFTVVISYMVPIVVIGFAVGSVFYHRCYKKGRWATLYPNRDQQQHTERTQFGGMSTTPIAADLGNSSNSNSLVADGSDGDGRPCNDAKAEGEKQSAFAKFISTLNLNLTLTKSKNSTDEEGDTEEAPNGDDGTSGSSSSDEHGTKKRKEIPVMDSPIVSPMSGETESNGSASTDKDGFKAYASVLPPMIVIDNIDIAETDSSSSAMTTTNPSLGDLRDVHIHSSIGSQIDDLDAFASEFRKQLLRKSGTSMNSKHSSLRGSYYDAYSGSSRDLRSDRGVDFLQIGDADDGREIVDTVSEDWDGDDLFPPIPANITAEGDLDNEVGLDDELDQDHTTSRSIRATSTTNASMKKAGYGTWDGSSSVENHDTAVNFSSSSLRAAMDRGTKSEGSLRKRDSLPPKRPPTPERGSGGRNNGDKDSKRLSLTKATSAFSFSPIARAFMGGGSSIDSGGHKRKSSADTSDDLHLIKNNSSLSGLSNEDTTNSNSKGNNWKEDNDTRLEFEAPRAGNWGLVLESTSMTGPRIYAVKDYSPLFGLVQKGDKLIEIDGKNVSQSNLTEVTRILKGKSSTYPYQKTVSPTMPIAVSRSRQSSSNNESSSAEAPVIGSFAYNTSFASKDRHQLQEQYSSYDNNRKGIYGSWGSNGSRVLEDIDEYHDNNIKEMDNNQLPQLAYHHLHDGSNEI